MEQIRHMLTETFDRFSYLECLIFHSDQGWQYQHEYFRSELKKHGIIQSMSRKGNCYDNSIMETFFGRLKNELYYGYELCYDSFEALSVAMEEYINYYNNERIQVKTKWMPHAKYREASMCVINLCVQETGTYHKGLLQLLRIDLNFCDLQLNW